MCKSDISILFVILSYCYRSGHFYYISLRSTCIFLAEEYYTPVFNKTTTSEVLYKQYGGIHVGLTRSPS